MENKDYSKIFDYITVKTGLKAAESNERMIKRFIDRLLEKWSVDEYILNMSRNPDLFFDLLEVFTINETYFFREEKYFKLFKNVLFPEYKEKHQYPPIIWSAATSSGEEAISLALLIKDTWGISCKGYKPVIASDIDVRTLNMLQKASYGKNSFRNDGAQFHPLIKENSSENNSIVTINREIIEMISVKLLNLILDDYEQILSGKPDIILICNVLIYMDLETRNKIIDKAVKVLKTGGYIVLSSSNIAFVEHPELELMHIENCYFFKKVAGN